MSEEDRLRKQVRVLEAQMYYKEKELLRVYRDLDRYRRKCDLLRLRLKKDKQVEDCATQTETEISVTVTAPVAAPVAASVAEPQVESPPAPQPAAKPKPRKSAISRLLNGAEPFNKAVAEAKSDPVLLKEEMSPRPLPPSPPQKRKAAYMEPYAPVKYQTNYTPTHLQPASNTPLYASLQRKESSSFRWRETFQMLKVMYLSKETFAAEDVAALRDTLNGQDPDPVATFLTQELAEAADVLNFSDALEIAFLCTVEPVGRNSVWGATFLKSLSALATDSTEQRHFLGCRKKMQSVSTTPVDGNLLLLIVHWHTRLCVASDSLAHHRDFLVMLLSRGNRNAAKSAYVLWGGTGLLSLKVIGNVLEGKGEAMMQEVSIRTSVASVSDESDVYKALKVMFRCNAPEAAYQLYSTHLWNVFAASFPDSVPRRVILKSLGLLIQTLDRANKPNAVKQLQECLEEILRDTSRTAFSEGEQRAAVQSLRKAGRQSAALSQWLHTHS